jgi:hypothetical protein
MQDGTRPDVLVGLDDLEILIDEKNNYSYSLLSDSFRMFHFQRP